MIHILGDSHTSVFTGLHGLAPCFPASPPSALPAFRVCHLGPYLAHSVATPGHVARRAITSALRAAKPREPVLMVFGEIDCRCHIVKLATSARSIKRVAAEVATRYARAAGEIARGHPVAVLRVPPATAAQFSNARFPTVGSFEERSRARVAFNRALERAARYAGVRVVGPTSALESPSGEPRPGLFADGVHADPRALPLFVRAFVRAGWLKSTDPTVGVARALATAEPPMDGRLRSLLIDRAALTCRALGATRVAIFGAGAHTRAIGLRPFQARGLHVVAVLDDQPSTDVLHGVRVLRPDALLDRVDAVIISSDMHERAIMSRAQTLFTPLGIPCVPIYDLDIDVRASANAARTVSIKRATKAS